MSESRRPGASRGGWLVRTLILAACVAVSLPVLYVGLGFFAQPACGCAATPSPYTGGPTATPWPVSASEAATEARKFTGIEMGASTWSPDTAPLYVVTAGGTYAFVDVWTATVLEVFLLNQMPASNATTITADDAQTAVLAYLDKAGVSRVGMTSSVQLRQRASIAFYDVVWRDAGGPLGPEVFVNPSTGAVFAFTDMGFAPKHGLATPIVGQITATRLAQSSTRAAGEPAMSTEFQLGLGNSGELASSWTVVFNDGALSVDAVTGQVAILKWRASH